MPQTAVSNPWAQNVDVLDLTDTDLVSARDAHTRAYDPSYELHRLAASLHRETELETMSETLDRAIRVAIADVIDGGLVDFTRADADVAYTIPPAGWLSDAYEGRDVSLVDEDEVERVETNNGRAMGFSTAPIVMEMAKAIVEVGVEDTLADLLKRGLYIMLGISRAQCAMTV